MSATELAQRTFDVQTEEEFNQLALDIFQYQVQHNPVYAQYLSYFKNRTQPKHYSEIPFLPIEFFKTQRIYAHNQPEEALFLSSGTTGMVRSHHFVASTAVYTQSFLTCYSQQIGEPKDQVILALLPNYLEQGNSSLVFMVDELIRQSNNPLSGFLLDQPDKIKENYELAIQSGKKVIIFGVSYALLDLADQGINLSEALIIETGGMKGRRKELTKLELHEILKQGLNVNHIASEYGMTELLSQGYSTKDTQFQTPNWMKILIRDVNDPFSYQPTGKTGGINVIDLANIYSCSFIATQDLGKMHEDQRFEILGRFDHSDIRGCNLLVQ